MNAKEAHDGAHAAARRALSDSAMCLARFAESGHHHVAAAAGIIGHCFREGGRVYICGNGGSAAQAQHMAAELVGRFRVSARTPLPAIALTTDTSILTSVANDFDYSLIFERQVKALCTKTDVLIALSTSGTSLNVLKAAVTAHTLGAKVIALTGKGGGQLAGALSDCWIEAPATDAARVQECHLAAIHAICELVEEAL